MGQSTTLEQIVIPLAVASVPFIWQFTAWGIRRAQFRNLILREISEVGPHPPKRLSGAAWTEHHTKKKFIHREIFDKPTENRDFILSLGPDLVYYLTQLWSSQNDHEQWMYMLFEIQEQVPIWQPGRRRKIAKARAAWSALMSEYELKFSEDSRWFLPHSNCSAEHLS